ncbi:zinc ribbon domain-containing protein, partial [uncultured Rothia sp.]|uniref:zinc ribbon domain-containing protein n=1 Tax=uncultured Rothia sp. TaxID=316088 RepID=UPI0037DC59FD
SERTYSCEHCGLVIDRDLNAAINIKVAGSAPETKNAHGGTGSRSDLNGHATQAPLKREPSCGDSRVRLGAGDRKGVLQATVK